MKSCEFCKKPLDTRNSRARFCSSACRGRAHRKRPQLRVAGPGDKPAVPLPLLQSAVTSGDQRQVIVALRQRIALALDDERTTPREFVTLSRLLSDLHAELEILDAQEFGDAMAPAVGDDEPWNPELI
jgi:hypothetical protein